MIKAIVVDKDYGSVSIEHLEQLQQQYSASGISLQLSHFSSAEQIVENCQDADILLATGNPPISDLVLSSLPKLKLVQRFGIGVNSVDLESAIRNQVLILNMPGFCVTELAVHAAAMILSLIRNLGFYDSGIRCGDWRKARGPVPRNPGDMTVGLYGFGGSARELYRIFHHGFGCRVVTHDPYFTNDGQWNVEQVSFDEMLAESDIISIHAPLTPETHHIFCSGTFEKMKDNAILVNIARGGLINQHDLAEALKSGKLHGAGLDVFEQEPLPAGDVLLSAPRTVLTPHSAFYGEKAVATQISLALELVVSVFRDNRVRGLYIANKGVTSKISGLS
ncbi:TPA: C-terminal binding protein, partial [Klebsiella quasipneumoniae subsp. quasipneumoniae]|nr:C-terminal binding protein [Klebsiella quasipneumoniae subsp. quasipneumoniae]